MNAALQWQPAEPANPTVALPVVPLVKLYLACVATWGAWIPVWIYRTARALDPAPERRTKHFTWAAGSLMPWFACLLAYELTRMAGAQLSTPQPATTRRATLAFTVTAVLVYGLFGSALSTFHSLKLLLLPIPVLLCQAAVNRRALASSSPAALGSRARATLNMLAALSIPAALLMAVFDGRSWERFNASTHGKAAKVSGTSGRYELTLPAGEWRVVPPGTFGDEDTELELERLDQSGTSWLIAYVEPDLGVDLDARVAARRSAVEASSRRLTSVQERRYFVDPGSFAVASLARYDAVQIDAPNRYWVLTTIAHGVAIELVSQSDAPERDEPTMVGLLRSMTLVQPEEAP